MPEATTKTGFVYLARVEGTDFHKIGISSDPERRVSDFGPPCELLHTVETFRARTVESYLLDRFCEHLCEGEWLQCSQETVAKITEAMNERKKIHPLPPRHGTLKMDAEGLRDEAATAIEESPYTQTDVAEQLDVNRTSVNRAVNSTSPKFEKLRQRIVEHLRGGRVEKRVTFVHVEDK